MITLRMEIITAEAVIEGKKNNAGRKRTHKLKLKFDSTHSFINKGRDAIKKTASQSAGNKVKNKRFNTKYNEWVFLANAFENLANKKGKHNC